MIRPIYFYFISTIANLLLHDFTSRSKLLTNKGICFHEITSCNKHEDCKGNNTKNGKNSVDSYCCLNHCCPAEYYHAWREWPCHSQFSCQQLGTGTHCCNEHDEIISDDIITNDYPKHKTKCCFQNKVS